VIEPLREEWISVRSAAEVKRAEGDMKRAEKIVRAFHDKLCDTRVLDPACGAGNFLQVSLELMKRLEGKCSTRSLRRRGANGRGVYLAQRRGAPRREDPCARLPARR